MFVESFISDPEVIKSNVKSMCLHHPVLKHKPLDDLVTEFNEKTSGMATAYEPLSENYESDTTWIKLVDSQRYDVHKPVHDVTMPLIVIYNSL